MQSDKFVALKYMLVHVSVSVVAWLVTSTRMLPVLDVNTGEMFAFPEDFLSIVLEHQWNNNRDNTDLFFSAANLDNEGLTQQCELFLDKITIIN